MKKLTSSPAIVDLVFFKLESVLFFEGVLVEDRGIGVGWVFNSSYTMAPSGPY